MSYGPVWVDLEGLNILDAEIKILQHKNTGGVLLFSKNYANKSQLTELVQSIRNYANKPILIGVDHEGGRIWRFKEGFTCPPAAAVYGALYEQERALALRQLNTAGQTIAQELLACGIDLSFAPVLDLNHGVSEVIGDRAYHSNPNIVTACARAFISGLNQQGMGAIGKHFPGHGGCAADSHFSTTVDQRSLADIRAQDLVPFKELHSVLTGIMPAHVIYPSVDPLPAGFSKVWLQQILRKEIGFEGAIISDCLSMKGSGFYEDMVTGAQIALQAGCDMVIATQQTREYLLQVLDALDWDVGSVQNNRIKSLRSVEKVLTS